MNADCHKLFFAGTELLFIKCQSEFRSKHSDFKALGAMNVPTQKICLNNGIYFMYMHIQKDTYIHRKGKKILKVLWDSKYN